MNIYSVVIIFLSCAAQVFALTTPGDAPEHFKIIGLSVLGSGCPPGSAEVQTDANKTRLWIAMSEFTVQTGPGTSASDWRKNCKLTLNAEFDEGYQFSTGIVDLAGYAQIPSGVNGRCSTTFDFTGFPQKSRYTVPLNGSFEGDFNLRANTELSTWSPCGSSTAILNMNSDCSVLGTQEQSLITVDRISSKFVIGTSIQWRSCPEI